MQTSEQFTGSHEYDYFELNNFCTDLQTDYYMQTLIRTNLIAFLWILRDYFSQQSNQIDFINLKKYK